MLTWHQAIEPVAANNRVEVPKVGIEGNGSRPLADCEASFESLVTEMRAAVERGDVEGAHVLSESAVELGRQIDQATLDRALCNRASYRIALERGDEVARELQQILMRSTVAETRYLAAYNLAVFNDRRSAFDKSRFYAQIALSHAREAGNDQSIAHALNQLAIAHVADSYFSEALDLFDQALDVVVDGDRVDRALTLANAGYCQFVTEDFDGGFRRSLAALRMLRRLGASNWERRSRIRLILCYGYIEIGRLNLARRHGERGLAGAEADADRDGVMKALYLLGETEKLSGDPRAAFVLFSRLQREFFPDNAMLADLLMQASTHQLVNLLA